MPRAASAEWEGRGSLIEERYNSRHFGNYKDAGGSYDHNPYAGRPINGDGKGPLNRREKDWVGQMLGSPIPTGWGIPCPSKSEAIWESRSAPRHGCPWGAAMSRDRAS